MTRTTRWASAYASARTDDWREIVGVVADVHDNGVDTPAPTTVYWPVLMDRFEGQKEDVAARDCVCDSQPAGGIASVFE